MADIDRQKELIGILKALLLLSISILTGLFGYVFDKFDKLSFNRFFIIDIVAIIIVIVIIFISFKLSNELNKLKDM